MRLVGKRGGNYRCYLYFESYLLDHVQKVVYSCAVSNSFNFRYKSSSLFTGWSHMRYKAMAGLPWGVGGLIILPYCGM